MKERRELYSSPQETRGNIERKGNIAHVYKNEGTHSFYYGSHETPMDPARIPQGIDAVFLETPPGIENFFHNWANSPTTPVYSLRKGIQMSSLFPEIERRRIPILLGDIQYEETYRQLQMNDWYYAFLESGLSAALGSSSLVALTESPMSRRRFLKGLGIAGLGVSAWLALPFVAGGSTLLTNKFEIGNEVSADLTKISEKLHQELYIKTKLVRNAVLAHKQEWLLKNFEWITHTGTIIGAGHVGIEESLQTSPKERIDFLRKTKDTWGKTVAPETFYKIVTVNFNGAGWETGMTYEVPDLKDLMLS